MLREAPLEPAQKRHTHKGVTRPCQRAQNCPVHNHCHQLNPDWGTHSPGATNQLSVPAVLPQGQHIWCAAVQGWKTTEANSVQVPTFCPEHYTPCDCVTLRDLHITTSRRAFGEVLSRWFSGEPVAIGRFWAAVSVAIWPPDNWGCKIKGNQTLFNLAGRPTYW